MRVLLDTNILVRAASGPPSPADKVRRLLIPPHTLITSQPILDELSKVLRYERVRRIHQLDDAALDRYLLRFQSAALVVTPRHIPSVANDSDDNIVIATAITGNAEVLCTLDHHLRHLNVQAYCARHDIRVFTDVELLDLLRE